MLSLLVGKSDVTGEKRMRERERDRGTALASASTLNRMELGDPEEAANDRYKRIVARPEAFDELLVELFVESHSRARRASSDSTSMRPTTRCTVSRKGDSFTATTVATVICRCTSSAASICCGARLREANQDASAGSIEELERIVGQIPRHWPRTRINIRGDSGFCRDSIMKWCEEQGVGFVLGLARNQRLVRAPGRRDAGSAERSSSHR